MTKDKYINPNRDYRCSDCGILLESEYAGNHNGERCEGCMLEDSFPQD